MKKTGLTHTITRIAIFGALSGLLYSFIKFPLPFMPPFLEINFSDIPAFIAAYAFGPLVGALVQVIKVVIKIVIVGTSTAYVGEFADIVFGIAIVVPAGIIYGKYHSFKGAIYGAIAGGIFNLIVTSLGNYWIMIPFYIHFFFNGNEAILLGIVQGVNPSIVDVRWSLIWWGILPFNMIKNTVMILLTFVIYKRLSPLIKKI